MVIRELKNLQEIHFELLLSADPSRKQVHQYIRKATVFCLEENGELIGCYAFAAVDQEVVEIKNIAVQEHHQRQGHGTVMLNDAIDKARAMQFKKIIIGTGNSSIGQLHLYQKVGFRISDVKKDFFSLNYEQPIFENGIECRDMIVLTKEL
jgi:N-acetylglutamate synthase-like GNAT family acetyltransferase